MSRVTKELLNVSKKNDKKMDKKQFNFYKQALKDMKKDIKSYVDNYETLSYSQKQELARRQVLYKKIDDILYKLSNESQMNINEFLNNKAIDGYLGVMYSTETKIGLGLNYSPLRTDYIKVLVNKKIAGKTFSQRLYGSTRTQLAKQVKQELLNDAAINKGYSYIAKGIEEKTVANYKQSLRIARTEGHRVQSEATQTGYEEVESLGVEMKKMWVSTLDGDTRDTHQELDGQIVGIDEEFENEEGETTDAPGLFGDPAEDCNCRCTTESIIGDIENAVRLDNVTRETIPNMTYKEWKDKRGVEDDG